MSRVLVTGGAGFIGSHLVDALVQKKHQVVVADDLSVGQRKFVSKKATFYKIKIQHARINDIFRKHRFDYVYHLAAQKNLQVSKDAPAEDAETNVVGSVNVLTAAKRYGVKKFIFYSTAAVYDPNTAPPNKETDRPHPVTPYGIGKYAFELYLQNSGIAYSTLRLSNVYGPRQDAFGEGGVVAIFAQRLAQGKQCTINNTGRQTRDFIYVDDVVRASLKTLHKGHNTTMNISTARETPVNQLYTTLEQIAGKKIRIKRGKLEEQFRSALSNQKAKRSLQWTATTNLITGLEETYNWFKYNNGK